MFTWKYDEVDGIYGDKPATSTRSFLPHLAQQRNPTVRYNKAMGGGRWAFNAHIPDCIMGESLCCTSTCNLQAMTELERE